MAGDVELVAGVIIVSFLAGALFALIAVVAAGIRGEKRAMMRRQDKRIEIRLSLPGHGTRGYDGWHTESASALRPL